MDEIYNLLFPSIDSFQSPSTSNQLSISSKQLIEQSSKLFNIQFTNPFTGQAIIALANLSQREPSATHRDGSTSK
jgi:hypothetical protein